MQRELHMTFHSGGEAVNKKQVEVIQSHKDVVTRGVVIDPATFSPVVLFLVDDSNSLLMAYIKQFDNLQIV